MSETNDEGSEQSSLNLGERSELRAETASACLNNLGERSELRAVNEVHYNLGMSETNDRCCDRIADHSIGAYESMLRAVIGLPITQTSA